jgi:hypothetical protein
LAEPLTINVQQAAKAAPAVYTVPGSTDIEPLSAFAHYDGTAAAGSFRPALTFYSAAGLILARVFPGDTVAAGDEADVTFAPFLGSTGGSSGGTGAVREIKVVADTATLGTGNGQFIFAVGADCNGLNLTSVESYITTVSSSGLVTCQVRNVTTGFDMLSTPVTIDAGEFTSDTAATPPVIDAAHMVVATSDEIAIDVDAAGTGAKGLGLILRFDSIPGGTGAIGPTGPTGPAGSGAAELAYAEITSPVTITGGSAGASNLVVSSGAVTYTTDPILIEFYSPHITVVNNSGMFILLYDDTTLLAILAENAISASNFQPPNYCARRLIPSAGSHTYLIRSWSSGGNSTIGAGTGTGGAEVPAFIRITQAA